jgi:hypothetical protein
MKNKILAFLITSAAILMVSYSAVFAQAGNAGSGSGGNTGTGGAGNPPTNTSVNFKIVNPFAVGGDSLFGLLRTIVNDIILPIGGVLAVLAFIYSGFMYVMAQGKPGDIEKANRALLYTAIGTAVLLGSWVLANMVCQTIDQITPANLNCPTQ